MKRNDEGTTIYSGPRTWLGAKRDWILCLTRHDFRDLNRFLTAFTQYSRLAKHEFHLQLRKESIQPYLIVQYSRLAKREFCIKGAKNSLNTQILCLAKCEFP